MVWSNFYCALNEGLFKLGQNKYGRKTTYKTHRCLLDSGASHLVIKAHFVEALCGKNEIKDKAEWASAGGMVKVGSMLKLNFILPEFSESTTTLDTFSREYDFLRLHA